MRTRLLAATAATACIAFALPAHAAAPEISDGKGDSPVAGADIVSVDFTSTYKVVNREKKTTGYKVKLTLAAPPASQVWFIVEVAKSDCPTFEFEYSTNALPGGPSGARCADGINTKYPTAVAPAKVSGSTITWTVPTRIMPAGTVLRKLSARTYNFVEVAGTSAGFPEWDDAAAKAGAKFTVGR